MCSIALACSASGSFSSSSTERPICGPKSMVAGWMFSNLQMARNVCRYRFLVGLWFRMFESTGWCSASGGSSLPSVLSHSRRKLKSLALIAVLRRLMMATVSRPAINFLGRSEYFIFMVGVRVFRGVLRMVSDGYQKTHNGVMTSAGIC